MHLSDYVRLSIDNYERGELEASLLFACSAVDRTGQNLRPEGGVRTRFEKAIEDYLWLVEPMLAVGVNLETTTFAWPVLKGGPVRFSGLMYTLFRNHLVHGEPLPGGSALIRRESDEWRRMVISAAHIELPDTAIFALLAVAVFCRANAGERLGSPYFLSHAGRAFVIDEWWGREDDIRKYFADTGLPRVTFDFSEPAGIEGDGAEPESGQEKGEA